MSKGQRTKDKGQIVWLLFALVIIFVYFFGLTIPLLGPDEPRYSQIAREMFQKGDWVTPTLGGFDWFEKPALLYWLQIASYKLFGVSEFAARFGSAVFGLGTIFCLWILGKSVSGFRFQVSGEAVEHQISTDEGQRTKNEFANWLALIAASSIGLLVFSRGASFDIILTFSMTASLCCYFLFETFLQRHYFSEATNPILISVPKFPQVILSFSPLAFAYLFLFGFYFFIGLAILAKGLIGIVFPLAIVFFYHILKWELLPGPKFLISLLWGILLSLLIASVWYLPMYLTNGWKFVDEFFIQHHFQRYTSNKYQHPQPFWFFFLVLPLMTIPWLPFFLLSLLKMLGNKLNIVKYQPHSILETNSNLSVFALAWMVVPLVFFSLSGSKLPGYISPALPAALILTAEYVFRFVKKSPKRKYALQILAFLTFAVVAVLLQFVVPEFARADSTKSLIETADTKGYAGEKIVNLYTAAHNAEFYAAGRLLREADGKLKRYDDFSVLVNDLKMSGNARILVIMPQKDVPNLIRNINSIDIEPLAENGETAIILVKAK